MIVGLSLVLVGVVGGFCIAVCLRKILPYKVKDAAEGISSPCDSRQIKAVARQGGTRGRVND